MAITKIQHTDSKFSQHFRFVSSSGLVGTWTGGPFSNDLDHQAILPVSNITFADDLAGQKVVIGYDNTPVIGLGLSQNNLLLIAEVTTASGEITVVDDKRTPAIQRIQGEESEFGPIWGASSTQPFAKTGSGMYTELICSYTNTQHPGGTDGTFAYMISVVVSTKADRDLNSVKLDGGTELFGSQYEIITEPTSTGWINDSNMKSYFYYIPESSGELESGIGPFIATLGYTGTQNGSTCILYQVIKNATQDVSKVKLFVEQDVYVGATGLVTMDAAAGGLWSPGGGLEINELLWMGLVSIAGSVVQSVVSPWNQSPNEDNNTTVTRTVNITSRQNVVQLGCNRSTKITQDTIQYQMGLGNDRGNYGYALLVPPVVL